MITILSQVSGTDRHKAYRIKVQNYSEEEAGFWEDLKYDLIYFSVFEALSTESRGVRNSAYSEHNLFMSRPI